MKAWPEPIRREGAYKVYKGEKYTVYDDGNSAETPYQTDLAEAALERLRVAVEAIQQAHDDALDATVQENPFHLMDDLWREMKSVLKEIGEVPE